MQIQMCLNNFRFRNLSLQVFIDFQELHLILLFGRAPKLLHKIFWQKHWSSDHFKDLLKINIFYLKEVLCFTVRTVFSLSQQEVNFQTAKGFCMKPVCS